METVLFLQLSVKSKGSSNRKFLKAQNNEVCKDCSLLPHLDNSLS